MGVPGAPLPLTGSNWPASNPESPKARMWQKQLIFFSQGKGKRKLKPRNLKPKAWLPSGICKYLQVRGSSWSSSLISTAIMLIRGSPSP